MAGVQLAGLAGGLILIIVFAGVVVALRMLIRVCPSNHIMVVTGGTRTEIGGRTYGFRIQKGGWTFVVPLLQRVESIDLTIIPINVRVEGVNSANGIDVGADATACVCIDDQNEQLLYSAVQQLLGKSRAQIQEQIQQTMIGNFRAALNKTTPLQAIGMVESAEGVDDVELLEVAEAAFGKDTVAQVTKTVGDGQAGDASPGRSPSIIDTEGERAIFRRLLLEDCQEDLSAFGMDVVSVSLQRIWDTSNYIANLANKTLARKRQEVEIEEARLRALAEQSESDGGRRATVAQNQADQRIVQATQEVELFQRQCQAQISRARLEADSGIAEAQSEGQRQVEELRVKLQALKNQSDVTLEAHAQRQAAEILAEGEAQTVKTVQQAYNDLLEQKVTLVKDAGDIGKIALFVSQLPALFGAYQDHASSLAVDELLVMNEEDGFNSAVNRGPAAMVDFLNQFEAGFGINVKDLLARSNAQGRPAEGV